MDGSHFHFYCIEIHDAGSHGPKFVLHVHYYYRQIGSAKPVYVVGFKFYGTTAVLSFHAVDTLLVSGSPSGSSEVHGNLCTLFAQYLVTQSNSSKTIVFLFIIATVQDNYTVIPVTDGGGIALFCHFMTIVYRSFHWCITINLYLTCLSGNKIRHFKTIFTFKVIIILFNQCTFEFLITIFLIVTFQIGVTQITSPSQVSTASPSWSECAVAGIPFKFHPNTSIFFHGPQLANR